jgi:tetratricopeptide (TPR) repeat protein
LVYSALALVERRLGNTEQAAVALGKARSARDGLLEAVLTGGVGFWPTGWWEDLYGEILYREASTLIHGSRPPEDPRLAVLRGRALDAIGRSDEAHAEFARIFAIHPEDLLLRVYALPPIIRTDDFARVLGDLRAFLKEHPEQSDGSRLALARAHLKWGAAQWTAGRRQEAVTTFGQAIEVAPKNVQALIERGQLWLSLNETANAMADFSNAVQQSQGPDHAAALRNRAEQFIHFALLKEAAADLAQAYDLQEPENPWDLMLHALLRAYVADGQGYRDASRRMLERFGELTHPEIRCQVAAVLAFAPDSGGEPSRAVALGEAAVADNRLVWRVANLGVEYYRAGEFDRAKAALEESLAIAANWNPPVVQSALAMAHLRLGNTDQASSVLGKARSARDGRIEAMLAAGVGHWPNPWWEFVQGELIYNEAYARIHGSPPPEDPRLALLRERALKAISRQHETRER